MKKSPILLSVIFLFAAAASGQEPCTPAALAQKPGQLRASRLTGSTGGLGAADVARAKSALTKVHQSIAAGYQPLGVVGDYSYHFSGGPTGSTFGYSLYLLKYNCDGSSPDTSKFYVGTDTPTVVRVDANVINAFSLAGSDTTDNTFRGYLFMRNLPRKVDGFYYLGDNPAGNAPRGQKEYTWLVTYGDKLPFSTLTRKEFLLLTRDRLEKSIRENGNSGGFYDQYLNRVNEQLRKADAELARPAIINRMDEERFTGFLEEGTPGAYYAIRHDPSYYRPGLPRATPQFFTVVYSVYEGDPVYPQNIAAVRKALDLNFLKGLLGR